MNNGIWKSSASTGYERGCHALVFLSSVLFLTATVTATDVVEFLNGAKLAGQVTSIRKGKKEFDFEAKVGNRTRTRTYRFGKVHAVTINGTRHVLTPTSIAESSGGSAPSTGDTGAAKTKAEIYQLINEAGTTPPVWFDSTALNYPRTLDLSWPQPPGGWDAQKYISHYMFSVINENPRRESHPRRNLHRHEPGLCRGPHRGCDRQERSDYVGPRDEPQGQTILRRTHRYPKSNPQEARPEGGRRDHRGDDHFAGDHRRHSQSAGQLEGLTRRLIELAWVCRSFNALRTFPTSIVLAATIHKKSSRVHKKHVVHDALDLREMRARFSSVANSPE